MSVIVYQTLTTWQTWLNLGTGSCFASNDRLLVLKDEIPKMIFFFPLQSHMFIILHGWGLQDKKALAQNMAVITLIWCPCAQSLLWRSDTGQQKWLCYHFHRHHFHAGNSNQIKKTKAEIALLISCSSQNLQRQQTPEDIGMFSQVDNLLHCWVKTRCCYNQIGQLQ